MDELLNSLDSVQNSYDELINRLFETEKSEIESLNIYEQVNTRLNAEQLAILSLYIANNIPLNYVKGLERTQSIIPNTEIFLPKTDLDIIRNDYKNFRLDEIVEDIDDLIVKHTDTITKRLVSAKNFKTSISNDIIFSKNARSLGIETAQKAALKSARRGVGLESIIDTLEETFKRRKIQITESGKYMFRTLPDSRGITRRMTHRQYAGAVADSVVFNGSLEGDLMNFSRAGLDLARIPTNAGTTDRCLEYQNKIVSLSGRNAGRIIEGQEVLDFPSLLASAGSKETHWGHIHCNHRNLLYVDENII